MEAKLPQNEEQRLTVLRQLNILDTPIEERFERITRMVCRSLKVPIAAVSMVDESRQWFKSIQGLSAAETPREIAFCAHAILKDELLLVKDATQDERFADNPLVTDEPFIRFYAGYPLNLGQDFHVGTLCAIDRVPRDLSTEEQEILYDLSKMVESELAAIALSEAQMQLIEELDELERVAMLDSLTRLWNRLGIETLLQREWDYATRKDSPIAIVMIDFDNFKQINDQYGHLVGDEVLQGSSRLIISALRSYDALGRWGGDEFMLILPGSSREQTALLLERIQAAIAQNPVPTSAGPMTISLSMGGVSVFAKQSDELKHWVEQADNQLMKVKRLGKGNFRLAE
ncbi:diguanylate cyclase [Synechocystis sp. FACHB-383]|uniref:GGDEF domain-containing protein n=1 Tax=Synechocystis sp. FACHB-383 TaxID=2692864 RepID=UPI001685C7A6|nr:diguanylate cyclase [Synechocystis sp. FACHB-383]MBD2655357.1 diguanylate cyclase [Synechocystis sp. FACHB-383]